MPADSPPPLNSPTTGVPASFRNPFEERDPAEVWKELLAEPMEPISREEAMRRMVEADKNGKPINNKFSKAALSGCFFHISAPQPMPVEWPTPTSQAN